MPNVADGLLHLCSAFDAVTAFLAGLRSTVGALGTSLFLYDADVESIQIAAYAGLEPEYVRIGDDVVQSEPAKSRTSPVFVRRSCGCQRCCPRARSRKSRTFVPPTRDILPVVGIHVGGT